MKLGDWFIVAATAAALYPALAWSALVIAGALGYLLNEQRQLQFRVATLDAQLQALEARQG